MIALSIVFPFCCFVEVLASEYRELCSHRLFGKTFLSERILSRLSGSQWDLPQLSLPEMEARPCEAFWICVSANMEIQKCKSGCLCFGFRNVCACGFSFDSAGLTSHSSFCHLSSRASDLSGMTTSQTSSSRSCPSYFFSEEYCFDVICMPQNWCSITCSELMVSKIIRRSKIVMLC